MDEDNQDMKIEIKISGCPNRDINELKHFLRSNDYYFQLWDIEQAIRDRLKYGTNVSEEEQRTLEGIRSLINIDM